ncbi:hypothetical protein AA105894_0170 [Asaia spathodeae NBRC 105894]|nr:hypothetical protein AA105894_0170 [Asaia spathodeae NBRC 105894]
MNACRGGNTTNTAFSPQSNPSFSKRFSQGVAPSQALAAMTQNGKSQTNQKGGEVRCTGGAIALSREAVAAG